MRAPTTDYTKYRGIIISDYVEENNFLSPELLYAVHDHPIRFFAPVKLALKRINVPVRDLEETPAGSFQRFFDMRGERGLVKDFIHAQIIRERLSVIRYVFASELIAYIFFVAPRRDRDFSQIFIIRNALFPDRAYALAAAISKPSEPFAYLFIVRKEELMIHIGRYFRRFLRVHISPNVAQS